MAYFRTGGGGGQKCAYGSVTVSTSASTKVTTGFKPKFVCVFGSHSATQASAMVYSKEARDGYTLQAGNNAGTAGSRISTLPNSLTGNGYINSIDDDGFTISAYASSGYNAYTDNGKVYYVAVE